MILDSSLEPLIEGGNTIAVNADFIYGTPASASRVVTFENGGVHYVRLRFWNGCAASICRLSVSNP